MFNFLKRESHSIKFCVVVNFIFKAGILFLTHEFEIQSLYDILVPCKIMSNIVKKTVIGEDAFLGD